MSRLLQFHGLLLVPVQAITSSQGARTKGEVAHLSSNIYCQEYAVLNAPACRVVEWQQGYSGPFPADSAALQ